MTIIGLGEDGLSGLSNASQEALAAATIVTGAARHLDLLPDLAAEIRVWPVPFADGIQPLLALRGCNVVVLASGDPFWFGAGSVLARHLERTEWRALPAPSVASRAAAHLGWPLEKTPVFGLHAAPLQRLRPALHADARLLILLRDGAAVAKLATYITDAGFGASQLWVMEAMGGPRERVRCTTADGLDFADIQHPVCAALIVNGSGSPLPVSSGLSDDVFDHDGQITKRPIRAITLSTLAPRPGEHLWDIGAGSGAIGIEWMLGHPANRTTAIEHNSERAARIRCNANTLGADRLQLFEGTALEFLRCRPAKEPPDAVFIGGGLSEALLQSLWQHLPAGTRVVANSVTLETDTLLSKWHAKTGGSLIRIEVSNATPLGTKHSWKASYPVSQWSAVKCR